MGSKMTVRQMDYARNRLRDAYEQVLGDKPQGNDKDRYRTQCKLAKTGKFKVTPVMLKRAVMACERELARESRWGHGLAHHLEAEVGVALNRATKDTVAPTLKKFAAREKKLDAKYQIAKDELMLGDAGLALTLIEQFRQTKI